MKTFSRILIPFCILALALSCSEDESPKRNSTTLTGRWNGYEMGSKAEGFVAGTIGMLASSYAHGVSFFTDGTFAYRYKWDFNLDWEEGPAIGTYTITDTTIELLISAGTPDERVYVLEIIKFDANHLWIHDKTWSSFASGDNEPETHFERAD